jgi:hypothetical protein
MGEVIEIFQPFTPASARRCAECEEPHEELGVLCKRCRTSQRPVAATFVQGTIASAIADLRRQQNQGAPLAGPVAELLEKLQRAYDAAEPLIGISGRGYVECVNGEYWAYPEAGVSVGPFGNEDEGQQALTHYHDLKPKPVVR